MLKKLSLFFGLCALAFANEPIITKTIGDDVQEVRLGGKKVGQYLFEDITNLMKSNALQVVGKNKVTYRIYTENIGKIIEDIRATTQITKGTDNVAGTTNAENKESQLFLKGFKQDGYDENGFYIAKLSAFAGGLSKGYIYKSFLEVSSKDQKIYKVIEFQRVNFLDELTDIYTNYYNEKKELPLFIPAMKQFVGAYFDLLSAGLGITNKNAVTADFGDRAHGYFVSYSSGAGKAFGSLKVATKEELENASGTFNGVKTLVRNKLKAIKGTAADFNGYGTDLFERDGFVLNYATEAQGDDKYLFLGTTNNSTSDYQDILITHAAVASTIMSNHNIRNGYLVGQGMMPYDMMSGGDHLVAPAQFLGTGWVQKKKFGAKTPWYSGAMSIEGDQLFALQSFDYINLSSTEAHELLNNDYYEKQRIIPTILPFAQAIGFPKVTHQGHIMSHVLSFIGYGTSFGGVDGAWAEPTNPGARLGFNEEYAVMNSFGAIEAGYAADKVGGDNNKIRGRIKGSNHHGRSSFGLWSVVIGMALGFGIHAVVGIEFIVAMALFWHPLKFPGLSGSLGAYGGTGGDVGQFEMIFTPELNPAYIDTSLIENLKYSSVYTELFLHDNTQTSAVLDNAYSQNVVAKNPTDGFTRLKNPNNNAFAEIVKAISKKKYADVFSHAKSYGYDYYRFKFEDDTDILGMVHAYTKGN